MKTKLSQMILWTTCLLLCGGLRIWAQVPGLITYQGRLTANATNFNGTGQFKFALVNGGSNTAHQATAAATVTNGFIIAIDVTYAGSGYATAPAVTITDATGSGAAASATLSGGTVSAITVLYTGSSYSASPTVTIAPPPPNYVYISYWSNDGTSTSGSEPASAVTTTVSQGLFTVFLGDTNLANMTALPWNVFLNPGVCFRIWFNDGVQGFQQLTPDQRVASAGYAMVAEGLSRPLSSGGLAGAYSNAVSFANPSNSYTGNGAGLNYLNADQLTSGTVPDARLAANVARTNQVWLLGGNIGTTAGTHFLGTSDNQPLEIKVNRLRALRLENNGDSADSGITPDGAPNVIGGSPANFVGAGIVGAAIGGGGATNYGGIACTNSVLADFGAVGGGMGNRIAPLTPAGTIAGGAYNKLGTNCDYSVIGGGYSNKVEANSGQTTIAGGWLNEIGADSDNSAIGGGYNNTIAGISPNATIAGGEANSIETNCDHSFIGGGELNIVHLNAGHSTIAGGYVNGIGTNSDYGFVGGGWQNNIAANTTFSAIAGGEYNDIGSFSDYSAIGGGGEVNIGTNSDHAVISGGHLNDIENNSSYSILGGGDNNNIRAYTPYAVLGGGWLNNIGTNSDASVVGGGYDNNVGANAPYGTIPGGRSNYATNYAFAAGNTAKAIHTGAFVWSDGGGTYTASITNNSVTMRARGGFRFLTGSGSSGAELASGATSWSVLSDRNLKKDFTPVDSRAILEKLAALPITQWRYQWEDQSVTSHIGPMAQDFKPAFYPGAEDKSISTQEADGVALAAIQGLNQKLEEQIKARDETIQDLKGRLEKFERLLTTLAQKDAGR